MTPVWSALPTELARPVEIAVPAPDEPDPVAAVEWLPPVRAIATPVSDTSTDCSVSSTTDGGAVVSAVVVDGALSAGAVALVAPVSAAVVEGALGAVELVGVTASVSASAVGSAAAISPVVRSVRRHCRRLDRDRDGHQQRHARRPALLARRPSVLRRSPAVRCCLFTGLGEHRQRRHHRHRHGHRRHARHRHQPPHHVSALSHSPEVPWGRTGDPARPHDPLVQPPEPVSELEVDVLTLEFVLLWVIVTDELFVAEAAPVVIELPPLAVLLRYRRCWTPSRVRRHPRSTWPRRRHRPWRGRHRRAPSRPGRWRSAARSR